MLRTRCGSKTRLRLHTSDEVVHLSFMFQDISRLTFESFADCFQRRKADRSCLAVFQDGDIGHCDADFLGKFGDAHLPLCQHNVDIDDDCDAGSLIPSSRSRTSALQRSAAFFQTPPQPLRR